MGPAARIELRDCPADGHLLALPPAAALPDPGRHWPLVRALRRAAAAAVAGLHAGSGGHGFLHDRRELRLRLPPQCLAALDLGSGRTVSDPRVALLATGRGTGRGAFGGTRGARCAEIQGRFRYRADRSDIPVDRAVRIRKWAC